MKIGSNGAETRFVQAVFWGATRVQLTSVQVTRERDRGENVLAVRVRYNLISANVPGNNVILAGLEQTVFV